MKRIIISILFILLSGYSMKDEKAPIKGYPKYLGG